ncbi:tyrosine-type recombinase/integrase [Cupriavidus sp. a3]|uniref:tyrosine-type recombinase/integrase n=1 Tax=Cupriavidus sp. a3 TaxID=3242158 RepID=UPI003D9C466E
MPLRHHSSQSRHQSQCATEAPALSASACAWVRCHQKAAWPKCRRRFRATQLDDSGCARVPALVVPGLEGAIPRIRRWRHAALPACLSTDEVNRVIAFAASGDTYQPLRNTAIVLLLARTGMRAAEVTKLTLDDIDWGNGVIRVRGTKSRRDRDLRPRRRPRTAGVPQTRAAALAAKANFLEAAPPWEPFADSSSISKIVRRAMTRADISSARGAAHLLRHAAATNMLKQETSFKGIAGVLGHQSLQSTAIYAKLDLPALSRIAKPWPEAHETRGTGESACAVPCASRVAGLPSNSPRRTDAIRAGLRR